MKTLEDRPVRVASEPYLLHLWRLLWWVSELRLVPYVDERRRDPVSRLLRGVLFDGLTRTGKLLFIVAVLILLLSFRNFQIFYLSTAAAIIGALVWSRLLGTVHRPKVTLSRFAPPYAEVERPCRSRIALRHQGRFALRNFALRELVVRHARTPPEWELNHVTQVAPGESTTVEVVCTPRRRGIQQLVGIAVQTYFPFFLTRASQRIEAPAEVPVLPAPYPGALPSLRQLAQQAADSVSFGNDAGGKDRALDYLYSRPFHSGDSIRRLDQRASARRGEPLTKVYDGTDLVKPEGVAVILDTRVVQFPLWKPRPDDPQILDQRLAVVVDLVRRGVAEGLALHSVHVAERWQSCRDLDAFYRLIATARASHESALPDTLPDERLIYLLVCGHWTEILRGRVDAWRRSGRVVLVMLVPEREADSAAFQVLPGFYEFPRGSWREAA